MKTIRKASFPALHLLAVALGTSAAFAGSPVLDKAPAPVAPVEETPFVTGSLTFAVNTHFISYGQDIWGAGNNWDDILFNPSLELNFDLGGGWTGIIGTWWDVNDNADSNIGDSIQEVDVWVGLGYGIGDWSFKILYQEWLYASQSERIVDLIVGYDHFLNPSLTLHGRVDGAEPFDTGLATVVGIAPGTDVGPFTLSFPINVAFDTDNFHGGDAGFSFASGGISISYAITEHITASVGATYYYTNDEVIPVNVDDSFVTGSASISISF